MVDGVAVHTEEFSGLPDRNVLLARLCALCAVLSHDPMLDPSETTRKPSDGILARLKEKEKLRRGQSRERKAPRRE
jgi:hypothetical protein